MTIFLKDTSDKNKSFYHLAMYIVIFIFVIALNALNAFAYVGEASGSFNESETHSIADCEISYTGVYYFSGYEICPKVTVKYPVDNWYIWLEEGKEYTVVYEDNVDMGTGTIRITGMGCFTGTIEKYFKIYGNLEEADIKLYSTDFVYDGTAKEPLITVTLHGEELLYGADYMVQCSNNINPGTASLKIYSISTVIIGTKTVDFQIHEKNSNQQSVKEYLNVGTDIVNGTVLHINNARYVVTDAENYKLEFAGFDGNHGSSVKIPSTIKAYGDVYVITSIGKRAFYKDSTVKTITVPKTIKVIEKEAFYGCKRLKKIKIKSNFLINVKTNAIKGISKKAVIDVPDTMVKKYQEKLNKKTGFKKNTMKIK